MRIDAACKGIIPIDNTDSIQAIIEQKLYPLKIIGGGSNILMMKNVDAYILLNNITGIKTIDESEDFITVEVGAGESWHQFVMWCIDRNLGGLENLSLIPGKVGAAPMQNIGAYGVEQNQCFIQLRAIDLSNGIEKVFDKETCAFGYRESIFKHEAKDKYIITHVTYRLAKKPAINITYGAIQSKLDDHNIDKPTIKDVSDAIIEIRKSKLPDPKEIPNTGSFFKNPIVEKSIYDRIAKEYDHVPSYPVDDAMVKIPAAWLIQTAGYKGKRVGDAGTHKSHALVLVNYGNASGEDLFSFARQIQDAVETTFDIRLQLEVNIW